MEEDNLERIIWVSKVTGNYNKKRGNYIGEGVLDQIRWKKGKGNYTIKKKEEWHRKDEEKAEEENLRNENLDYSNDME